MKSCFFFASLDRTGTALEAACVKVNAGLQIDHCQGEKLTELPLQTSLSLAHWKLLTQLKQPPGWSELTRVPDEHKVLTAEL